MKVYLGIPLYGGAGGEFISALLKTRLILHIAGFEVEVDIHNGCSIVSKARNEIAKRFLDSGFDVLLFLDSDLSWNPVDAVRLLQGGHDFSGCIYRQKTEELKFNCNTFDKDGEWVDAEAIGTGFMALSRNCLLKMVEAYPQTRYEEQGDTYHALFDFELFEGRYWGEDYTFCRRWRNIGGTIKVKTDATIKHIGTKAYTGNYKDYLGGLNAST